MSIDDKIDGKKRILVAEDNASMRRLYQRALGREYDVIAVEDGQKALDELAKSELAKSEFSLVISDVDMPNKNGWEFYQESSARYPAYKNRFLFSFTPQDHPVYDAVMKSGLPCIQKGFEIESLMQNVKGLCK